ncbi:radical SAM family heme chaperone HemW [Magnetofaba australis]|uniref:Heme chaperone HemW n=1 Tax=Magnetofaba australis IT-1 TaxID=1434232 RepID=A0A1Y2K2Q4_9PROT|nr:radical SAM family heme chaperone HemW [Magnetofaba australis]OSM00472.1 putative coproporphyrinogen III oxidase [Magnetofaba australis IT-1]
MDPFPLPPLALYIHLPWCASKCPYCDFHSRVEEVVPQQRYIAALLQDLRYWRARLGNDPRPLDSLFLGGGTPSRFAPDAIAELLSGIHAIWPLKPGAEITLEANPESLLEHTAAAYKQAGITRLSVGIQALDDARLRFLERPHDAAMAHTALQSIAEAGFASWGLDLIYATPGQSLDGWFAELSQALAYQPPHLSAYALTIEPGTRFYEQVGQGAWSAMEEGAQAQFFVETRHFLATEGRPAYEISNFAAPGQGCRHNLNTWRFGDYLGLGAAAHGKISHWDGARLRVTRTAVRADAAAYMAHMERAGAPLLNRDVVIGTDEAADECVILGLRMGEGVALAAYRALCGEDLIVKRGGEIARYGELGLLERSETHVRLSEGGFLHADGVISALMD